MICHPKCNCKFKRCKSCSVMRPIEWYSDSDNSDDGKFPFCVKCVNRLKRAQEMNYAHYFNCYVRNYGKVFFN